MTKGQAWVIIIFLSIVVVFVVLMYVDVSSNQNINDEYKNITYYLNKTPVPLRDGYYESELYDEKGDFTIKYVTEYFGYETRGDLNGDGLQDVAFVIRHTAGGTGTFYYVVAAIKTPQGYQGTDAVLFGDRVQPKLLSIQDQKIKLNFLDRATDEPYSATPTQEAVLNLELISGYRLAAIAE